MNQWLNLLAQVSKPLLTTLVYTGTNSFLSSIEEELRNQQKHQTKMMLDSIGIEEEQLRKIQDLLQDVTSIFNLVEVNRERQTKEQEQKLQQQLIAQQQQTLREMAAKVQQTTLQLPEIHKTLENWPLRLLPAQLQKSYSPDTPLPLRIFLVPPKVSFKGFETIGLETQEIEQKLAQGLREFLSQNYSPHSQVRPTEFLGGAWQSQNFHGEASIKILYEMLQEQPTLILESDIEGNYLNFRMAYWGLGQEKYCYETIFKLSYRELIEELAKARALRWKDTRDRLLALGKSPEEVNRFGGDNAINLAIWEEAEQLQTAGIEIKKLNFEYRVNRKDLETLCQFLSICHCVVAGWVADIYYLIHEDLAPHLPQLLPQLIKEDVSEPKSLQMAFQTALSIYQSVFFTLATQRSYYLPTLSLKLAQSLTHLPDKSLALEQLYNSFQSWLKYRQSSSIEGMNDFLVLSPKDQEYLENLKACLSDLGDESGLREVQNLLIKLKNLKWQTQPSQQINFTLFHTFTSVSGNVASLTISSDRKISIASSDRHTIELCSLNCRDWKSCSSIKLAAQTGEIETFTLNPDRQIVASSDRTEQRSYIKIWNLETGKLQRTLLGHRQPIRVLAISPYHSGSDRQFIASGSHKIKLWDLQTGESFQTFFGHKEWVTCLVISADARILISGSEDTTIRMWHLPTGNFLRTLKGHQGSVCSLAISPDGQTLISGSDDRTIKLWDLETGKLLHTFTGHLGAVRAVAVRQHPQSGIAPNNQHLFSCSEDKTIKIWHLQTKELLQTLVGHTAAVKAIAISPDGQIIASESCDRSVKIWQVI
ncbi:WD40 repeat domain-containing protein [Pleurocapsales cyanobacterium LEGE 06147]|nr:WD40 repeat domain-containing protein [Pleurocapsales cyanobacterium LEGE 06147]